MARPGKGQGKNSQLRIIGGQWRGRKLSFLPEPGLRPTTDRIRETLFNWLAPNIHGARCADLFAGSGALGLEALSRGATSCDFVDSSAGVAGQIRKQLKTLDAELKGRTHCMNAEQFLAQPREGFDLVFIDPPFGGVLAAATCNALQNSGLITAGALVYVEMAIDDSPLDIPPGWSEHRAKASGGVSYRLFAVD